MPQGKDDERLKNRIVQLVKDHWLPPGYEKEHESKSVQDCLISAVRISSTAVPDRQTEWKVPLGSEVFQEPELQLLWDRGSAEDESFEKLYNTIGKEERSFPPD